MRQRGKIERKGIASVGKWMEIVISKVFLSIKKSRNFKRLQNINIYLNINLGKRKVKNWNSIAND